MYNKELRDDADKLRRMAPRNCHVLQPLRHDKAQRRLRLQMKILCKIRWHHKRYKINVLNVSVVTNVSLRQRYEHAYQAAMSAVPPSYCAAQSAAPPSYCAAQSAAPPSYLEAVNMAHYSPNYDPEQTRAVSLVEELQPGVLRRREMYLFCRTNESHLRAVLDSETETAFSCNSYFGLTGPDFVSLGEFSNYGSPKPGPDTKYLFVVRAIIGEDQCWLSQ